MRTNIIQKPGESLIEYVVRGMVAQYPPDGIPPQADLDIVRAQMAAVPANDPRRVAMEAALSILLGEPPSFDLETYFDILTQEQKSQI